MSAPCESDPVALAIELDAAWEAFKVCSEQLDRSKREATQYRRLHFREQPRRDAFGRIASLVWEWRHSSTPRPPAAVLELIQFEIERANRMAQDRMKAQEKA